MKKRICVIGGGPAGIIGAGIAASRGNEVTLIEKNEKLGKKLFITGKGRCNITNNSPIEDFFDNIIRNKNFLYSSFYAFTNEDIIKLLNKYGLEIKVERGNRVFPKSNKSSDVIKALEKFLLNNKVKIILNTEVKKIVPKGNKFYIQVNKKELNFDKVLIATGGKSYPTTGSTGDGYKFAEKLGHSIVKINPSLVPIETNESFIKNLQGLSLKNIEISAYTGNKCIYKKFGELVFTHYGISGPIVLSMSNYLQKYTEKNINFFIDLKPALSNEKLDQRILRDFDLYNNKQFKNSLNDLLPKKIIPVIINLSEIESEKPVNQITKEERNKILKLIKFFPISFKSFRPIEEAIVTSGGVCVKEIDSSTMESKIQPGLFFAGEVLDLHGLTGGYNLQIAYSTGFLAGENI